MSQKKIQKMKQVKLSVQRIFVILRKKKKKSCSAKQTLPALPQASHCATRRLNCDKVEAGRAKTGGLSCGGAGANAVVKAFRRGDESRGEWGERGGWWWSGWGLRGGAGGGAGGGQCMLA